MPPKKYITIGLPIDMTKENGYLYMSPEIHKEQKSYNNKDDRKIPKYYINKWKWNPVEIGLGDLVAFDSFTPHYSEINKTDKPRRIFYFTYNKKSVGDYRESYFKNKREKFPPDIDKIPGVDYSEIGALYNFANPMNTIKYI